MTLKKSFQYALCIPFFSLSLIACEGEEETPDITTPKATISPEPTVIEELPEPVIIAGENELVIFYSRTDEDYDDWVLHLWNGDGCDAYTGEDTEWASGQESNGIDANYGAYWVIPLKLLDDSAETLR